MTVCLFPVSYFYPPLLFVCLNSAPLLTYPRQFLLFPPWFPAFPSFLQLQKLWHHDAHDSLKLRYFFEYVLWIINHLVMKLRQQMDIVIKIYFLTILKIFSKSHLNENLAKIPFENCIVVLWSVYIVLLDLNIFPAICNKC